MKNRYTEEDIAEALRAITNGASIRRASLDYGVPRTTLHDRIYGGVSHQKGAQILQKLSPIQENRLAEWILVQEALGTSPTHRQIREMAEHLLIVRGEDPSLGKKWIHSFFRRHPNIGTKKQHQIDSARVSGATSDIIKKWFRNLAIPEIKAIKPANRWNMDEAGIMEGQGLNGLVVGSTDRRFIQKKQPGSRIWTSFIECISANGKSITPLVIYKGKSVQQQWFPTDLTLFKGWNFTATENGWTTDATALEWLKKIYIPQTTPIQPENSRLLILDGHGSHETTAFMLECFNNNIYLLLLPPHTSHVLQPLDLSVFSPLKSAYRIELNKLSLLSDSSPIGKRNFLSCYQKARIEGLTIQNIKSGWQASGLWPKNMAKPLMSRLLLENSNREVLSLNPESDDDPILQWNIYSSFIQWKTPQKGADIRKYRDIMIQEKEIDLPTRRLLFRKIIKGFDAKDYEPLEAENKIRKLEYQLDEALPRKRRKVVVSPNSKFAGIRAIRRTQIEAGDREDEVDDSSSAIESDSTGDFIEVQ
ncbi:uncharacterized protein EAF01_010031 [Botrytis porri]|uniref:uncharacterized protein n=1 Tax=Botrytis porri TaxID=87229 RepID=UPI001901BE84|nr:uncharacterized protein EAF01_010791 [Botrytis porri]XP_038766257.1 uncharacterized protein EAF01_010031 [Botrytis porri]KAF7889298.1 hypothetical protein EAF01_010791 [Botrytis porri]KAF7894580.1 hypothetical protein EAF01_010031 [Botrytis porri]